MLGWFKKDSPVVNTLSFEFISDIETRRIVQGQARHWAGAACALLVAHGVVSELSSASLVEGIVTVLSALGYLAVLYGSARNKQHVEKEIDIAQSATSSVPREAINEMAKDTK